METMVEFSGTPKIQGQKEDLRLFLDNWDKQYANQTVKINLFNSKLTSKWTYEQKQHYVKLLYHQRGHFHDVLWLMANFAPDRENKKVIIENIYDEVGKHGLSHEALYLNFAQELGLDLTYEFIEQKYYYPFLREYNKGHLTWLRRNDWEHRIAGFAVIEHLDNVDYVNLRNIALNIGVSGAALKFFDVHIYVKHFESLIKSSFYQVWVKNPDLVKEVFNFLGQYQLDIWQKISNEVFNYK